MVAREGDVVPRMPVFGADFEREGERQEGVDGGEDGAGVGDCEGAVLFLGEGEVSGVFGW